MKQTTAGEDWPAAPARIKEMPLPALMNCSSFGLCRLGRAGVAEESRKSAEKKKHRTALGLFAEPGLECLGSANSVAPVHSKNKISWGFVCAVECSRQFEHLQTKSFLAVRCILFHD